MSGLSWISESSNIRHSPIEACAVKYVLLRLVSSSCKIKMTCKLFCLAVLHGRACVRALNLHQCLWTNLQVLASKRLGCHADLYIVSRCHTRCESEDHTSEKACKESTLALEPRADITIQNRDISDPMNRTYVF